MDEKRGDDTLSERLTQGRTEPEKEEPAGANEAWSEEYSERETMERPVGSSEAGVMTLAGRYKVVRRLGEGGMGSVWLAEDLKLDGRRVAIKMLPAVLAGKKTAYRQVKQEALMAMKLAHPNIATVRAFEEEEGGNPFLVMDYIEGMGLDEILAEKGKLSEVEMVKLLSPVAAALDYAHEKGVVHRDVKPGNVMVAKDGTPYVLDFGIAREIQETMTRVTGKFSSGTLLYMSPEQLRGRAPKVAQDVYSFAAMAYECLSGAPPFARGQIEWQIVNEQPEPLEEGVASKALREGIMAGLAKEPGQRPGTCARVLGDGKQDNERHEILMADWNTEEGGKKNFEKPGSRFVDSEKGGEGEVFLRKVRLEKELAGLGEEGLSWEERAELRKIRELSAAGTEALKTGDRGAGAALYAEADAALTIWLAKRKQLPTERKAGETQRIILPGGATMEMVWCPPGSFMMGSPGGLFQGEVGRCRDEVQHPVTLTRGFWLAATPVTQRQWRSVMGNNPSRFKGAELPVENVSWEECTEFCRRAGNGLRLPTEAQWEYACRAGSEGTFSGTGRLEEMGWYDGNIGSQTHPVAMKQPNAWGLYDMHGNVWEWCADWYGEYPPGGATDPEGPLHGLARVRRGGAWNYGALVCRSACRAYDGQDFHSYDLGFRAARSPS